MLRLARGRTLESAEHLSLKCCTDSSEGQSQHGGLPDGAMANDGSLRYKSTQENTGLLHA